MIASLIERMTANNISPDVIAYVALHAQSGCRISDLLAVDHSSISNNLNISILQGKGSLPLIVQPVYFRDYWTKVKCNRLSPMENYNRFFFYRLYRKFGIVYSNGVFKNNSVTHAFRKALADDIYSIDNVNLRVQGALGHRSKESTEHYINKSNSSK